MVSHESECFLDFTFANGRADRGDIFQYNTLDHVQAFSNMLVIIVGLAHVFLMNVVKG